MLGECYSAEFFRDIKNSRIRSALTQIADETQEDLAYYEQVLKDFGCEVIRPEIDRSDSIMKYIDDNGKISGLAGVPRSPLQPRDTQLVIGNNIVYTEIDNPSIRNALQEYNSSDDRSMSLPLPQHIFENYRGDISDAPDWPTYNEFVNSWLCGSPYSAINQIHQEINEICKQEPSYRCSVPAPSFTVVGKDIYIDTRDADSATLELFKQTLLDNFPEFRCNFLDIGGHNDGTFHTVKPGVILSLYDIQKYHETFPGWDVCYLPDQSWSKVKGFRQLKSKVNGKWWVPGQEDNDEFTYFVETWLNDWVGYVEETVFDVNVLVLDEKHVCVSQQNNEQVNNFLKKHGMEPVYIPWRHRYFWDGGLHCITLDLYREGIQQDYFKG